MSALKSALFSALAILLSAGHSVCAGVIAQAPPALHHQQYAPFDYDDHGGEHGEHIPASHEPAPCGPDQHDCQHCKTAQYFKASLKAEITASLPEPQVEKAMVGAADGGANFNLAAKVARFAYLWRAPPDATPVSLKTRLLN